MAVRLVIGLLLTVAALAIAGPSGAVPFRMIRSGTPAPGRLDGAPRRAWTQVTEVLRAAQAAQVDRARASPTSSRSGASSSLIFTVIEAWGALFNRDFFFPVHRQDDLARLPRGPVRQPRWLSASRTSPSTGPSAALPAWSARAASTARTPARPGSCSGLIFSGRLHPVRLPRRADQHRPLPVRQGPPRQLVGVHLQRVRPGDASTSGTPPTVRSRRSFLLLNIAVITGFLVLVTYSKHLHIFVAPINVLTKREPKALGPLATTPDLESLMEEEEPVIGVGKVEQFSWKAMLDFATCTECGRCQSQCPAWNTDKPLSPKLLIMDLRDHLFAKAPYLLAGKDGEPETPIGGTPGAGEDREDSAPPRRSGVRLRPHRRPRSRAERASAGGRPRFRRRHRPRRALVLHHLRRLRRAVPGRHRARRPHPGDAPLPGADRVGVPERGRRHAAQPREQRQPLGREPAQPHRVDDRPSVRGPGHRRRRRRAGRRRVPLLGRLRRSDRRPQQEGHPGVRGTAAHGRRELRRAGRERVLHR